MARQHLPLGRLAGGVEPNQWRQGPDYWSATRPAQQYTFAEEESGAASKIDRFLAQRRSRGAGATLAWRVTTPRGRSPDSGTAAEPDRDSGSPELSRPGTEVQIGTADPLPPVAVCEGDGPAPVLLVCEHASNAIPARFAALGLDDKARASHIAWDLGALALARALATRLDAPLIRAAVSRLVFDLNRPTDAPDAIPERSELTDIPGNMGLSPAARQTRIDQVHRPWAAALDAAIETIRPAALISVHSFTPVFAGTPRSTEIGIIHNEDARLAAAVIARSGHLGWQRNRPYGPADGVTHTLKTYAEPHEIHPLMIEVRNDLLEDHRAVNEVATQLAGVVIPALEDCGVSLLDLAA